MIIYIIDNYIYVSMFYFKAKTNNAFLNFSLEFIRFYVAKTV